MKATVKILLYKVRIKKNKKYPLKLKVTFRRQVKFFAIGIDLTENEYSNLLSDKKLKQTFEDISYYLKKANQIIDDLKEEFTWFDFERLFYMKKEVNRNSQNIFEAISIYSDNLNNEGRVKTAETYITTLNNLKQYHKKKKLNFQEITIDWLKDFATYLSRQGLTNSSIGIYMRNIRTIFNRQISDKNILPEIYPFGKNKYQPPATRRVKKALSFNDVEKIFGCETTSETESWAKDIWIFSYLANGINIKDVAQLKYKNINGNEINLIRAKTKDSTANNQRVIQIVMNDELKRIINKWGNKRVTESTYIFDILNEKDDSPLQVKRDVNMAVKTINKYMKRIAERLGLEKRPTCNYARHTYSTILKRAGVSIEMISESLGHASIKTTEIYLDSFEKEQRAQISKFLIPGQKQTNK